MSNGDTTRRDETNPNTKDAPEADGPPTATVGGSGTPASGISAGTTGPGAAAGTSGAAGPTGGIGISGGVGTLSGGIGVGTPGGGDLGAQSVATGSADAGDKAEEPA